MVANFWVTKIHIWEPFKGEELSVLWMLCYVGLIHFFELIMAGFYEYARRPTSKRRVMLFCIMCKTSTAGQSLSRRRRQQKKVLRPVCKPAISFLACRCHSCSLSLLNTTTRYLNTSTRTLSRFNPGWMTSPLFLGFLYDPGISHIPRQTSASSTTERSSLSVFSLPRSLSPLSLSLSLTH